MTAMSEEEKREYRLTIQENRRRHDAVIVAMKEILKGHDIAMTVWACGCCSSPQVTFTYKGETILDDEMDADFEMKHDG